MRNRNPYTLTRDQDMLESVDNPKNIGIKINDNTMKVELTVDDQSETQFVSHTSLLEDMGKDEAQSKMLVDKNVGTCVGSLQQFKQWRDTPPHGHMELTEKEVEDLMELRGVSLSAHKHWPDHYKVTMMEARSIISKRRK